ncbi:MAG: hypothetical protein JWO36_3827 [Myxococcales bacterium]|nr:hypothetical protein [Myxococcales bacterium]
MRFAVALVPLLACSERAPAQQAAPPAPRPAAAQAQVKATNAKTADSVTAASPASKQGPAVVVETSSPIVDGAALRERNHARVAGDHSAIVALTGATPGELGERLCEAVVPKRPPSTPVLLKPNLGGFNWFHDPKTHHGDDGVKGRITDPEFTRGVVKCLKARGHTKITIADGFTGKAADWARLVKVSGYAAMAKEEGVALVALDDDGVFDVHGETPGKALAIKGMEHTHVPTLLMPKVLAQHLEHGLYLSLPKIKTHRFAVFSVAIKAMQGTVMYSDASPAFHQKWRSHRELDVALAAINRGDDNGRALYTKALEVFAERMVDILEVETPDAVLADGAPAMDGDGFDDLYPRAENVAIGGTNPVLVDRVAAEYLGLWDSDALAKELGGHRTSPLLEVAAKRFGLDLASPAVTGDGAKLVATPHVAHLHGMAGFEIGGEVVATQEVVPDGATKDVHAPKLAGQAPAIDGVIDAAWAAAPSFEFATDWAGRAVPTTTRLRVLWSPRALYLLWELDGTGLFTDRSRPTETERVDLYEEDCIELFLVPAPANRKRYAEIEVGPYGHWFDLFVDRSTKKVHADAAWSAGMTIGTARDEATHHAVIEMAITAPEIVAALVPDARLPVGLYRMEGKGPRQYLAAFPTRTPKPNFHVPDAFGALLLDP